MKRRLCLTVTLILAGLKLIEVSVNAAVCSNQRCDATSVERAETAQDQELEDTFRMYPGQDRSNEIHEGDRNVNIVCEVAADRAAAISVVHSTPAADGSEQCFCQLNSGESSMEYVRVTLNIPSPSAGDMVFCVAIPPPSRDNENMELIKSPPQTVQHPNSSPRNPTLPANPTTLTTTEKGDTDYATSIGATIGSSDSLTTTRTIIDSDDTITTNRTTTDSKDSTTTMIVRVIIGSLLAAIMMSVIIIIVPIIVCIYRKLRRKNSMSTSTPLEETDQYGNNSIRAHNGQDEEINQEANGAPVSQAAEGRPSASGSDSTAVTPGEETQRVRGQRSTKITRSGEDLSNAMVPAAGGSAEMNGSCDITKSHCGTASSTL